MFVKITRNDKIKNKLALGRNGFRNLGVKAMLIKWIDERIKDRINELKVRKQLTGLRR